MAIDSLHPKYAQNIGQWQKCRDVRTGEEAVKDKDTDYLPKLEGQEESEYQAYKQRAEFFNATERTVVGLSGMLLRKAPEIEWPDGDRERLEHIGRDGENLETAAKETARELIGQGRVGLLVDADAAVDGGELSPYIARYRTENILNWNEQLINGEQKLLRVTLFEMADEPSEEDPTEIETVQRIRELKLVRVSENSNTLVYEQQLWRKNMQEDANGDVTEEWVKDGDAIRPLKKGGSPWEEIPFVFINPTTLSTKVDKSPVLDLCNVNLSHYRTSADLEHGRHFTALPTPVVFGFDPKIVDLRIGSGRAWVSEKEEGSAFMLEFKGAGLASLSEAMREKQKRMAILGARLLEEQSNEAEAAKTVQLRQRGEQSILADLGMMVSGGLTKALEWISQWLLRDDKVGITLNTDFDMTQITPQTLMALMQGVETGKISWSTFFHNAQRGELYPDGLTQEQELDLIINGPEVGLQNELEAMRRQREQQDQGQQDDGQDEGDEDE